MQSRQIFVNCQLHPFYRSGCNSTVASWNNLLSDCKESRLISCFRDRAVRGCVPVLSLPDENLELSQLPCDTCCNRRVFCKGFMLVSCHPHLWLFWVTLWHLAIPESSPCNVTVAQRRGFESFQKAKDNLKAFQVSPRADPNSNP